MLLACSFVCIHILSCVSVLDYMFFESSIVILIYDCRVRRKTEAWLILIIAPSCYFNIGKIALKRNRITKSGIFRIQEKEYHF